MAPTVQEEPSNAENLLAVKCLMSALESMCQEIAKSKAEVACIAVYEKEVFVVGTEGGRSFIGSRNDFQRDFIKHCVSETRKTAEKRIVKNTVVPRRTRALSSCKRAYLVNLHSAHSHSRKLRSTRVDCIPSVALTPVDKLADIKTLRKSVEDVFCLLYGKAHGKCALIPVPYEKILKDPEAVAIKGMPDGVSFKQPALYDIATLEKVLERKAQLTFVIKRPFQDSIIQRVEMKRKTEQEIKVVAGNSFIPVQVKTEPSDDNQPTTSVDFTVITVRHEKEDPDYYRDCAQACQEPSETGKDPEIEVTLEGDDGDGGGGDDDDDYDDEYAPPNKRPKATESDEDDDGDDVDNDDDEYVLPNQRPKTTVERESRKFNFDYEAD